MKLYKYRSLLGGSRDNTYKIITDNELYFAPPISFNDPFEFLFHLDLDSSLDKKIAFLSKTSPEIVTLLSTFTDTQKIDYLNSLNVDSAVRLYRKKIIENSGVLCLSDSPFNINMWSYYGDSHKGICFEFEFNDEDFANTEFEVQYSDKIPLIKYFEQDLINLGQTMRTISSTKYSSWAHEKEFRMVRSQKGAVKFNPTSLRAIYVGSMFDQHDNIFKVISDNCSDLSIYRLGMKKMEFALELRNETPLRVNDFLSHYT